MKTFDQFILFKQTELGLLPSSWKVEKLGSLTSHIIDCLHEKKPDFIDEGDKIYFEVYNIGQDGFPNLIEVNHVTDEVYNNWIKRLKPQNRDIVISKTGRVGAVTILPYGYNFCIGRNQVLIRAESTKILPEFLLLYLYSSNFQGELKRLTTDGTILKSLHVKYISQIRVPLPDINEQKTIVEIVYSLMIKIRNNEEMNSTLESLALSLFHSWFVRFDPFQDGEFEESELGKIPKGWEIKKINEICTTQYGYTQSASIENIGPRFLRITDIQGSKINWNEVPFCEIINENCQKYKLHSGDILIARTGASTGENVYIEKCPNAVFASYLIRLKFQNINLARYVGVFLRSYPYKKYIEKILGGSAQPNANAKTLTDIRILIPPDEVLDKFGILIKTLEETRYANSVESITLSSLRDLLLPQLISGKLRIPNTVKFLEEINGENN